MLSLNLEKGMSLNLSKEDDSLKKLQVGLGWDTHMDLDSIAILLDKNEKVIETVCYYNKVGAGVVLNDPSEKTYQLVYQTAHHQFIASALAVKACHDIDPDAMVPFIFQFPAIMGFLILCLGQCSNTR